MSHRKGHDEDDHDHPNKWTAAWQQARAATKWLATGAATGLAYLVGIWSVTTDASLTEALNAMTGLQWALFTTAVLGGLGVDQARNRST